LQSLCIAQLDFAFRAAYEKSVPRSLGGLQRALVIEFSDPACNLCAAPLLVNRTSDAPDANPGDGICETAAGNGLCALRAAVQEANALPGADTLIVPAGIYTLTMLESYEYRYGGGLYITDTVTINGAGPDRTIIDGGGDTLKSRLFAIGGPIQVEISGLTMQNGRPGQTGSNLNLIRTALINNRSTVAGGLLAGTGSVITMTDSMLIGNVSIGSSAGGGGLTLAGGATATIKRSLIARNTSASDGGGIDSHAALTIEDRTISDNTTTWSGGGMYIEWGPTTLRNVTIAGNVAGSDQSSFGGGIYNIGISCFTH
jgi:hypothetical protein